MLSYHLYSAEVYREKKKGKMVTPVVQHHLDQSILGLLKKNGVNVDDTS